MQPDRTEELRTLLKQRILILDGAMGTEIQQFKLGEADYRGARFADHASDLKGNNDLLLLTKPEVIRGIHAAYLAAGADIIETNTFNSTRVSQAGAAPVTAASSASASDVRSRGPATLTGGTGRGRGRAGSGSPRR